MSAEIDVPIRGREWVCNCTRGIRAASCQECVKCGARRPYDTGETLALTSAALQALDVYDQALRLHGNRAAAMAAVLEWTERRQG